MAVLALKQFLSGAQALKADVYEDRLRVLWDEKQNAIAPEKLVPFLSAQKGNAKLIPPSSLELKLDMQLPTPRRLDAARLALGTLERVRKSRRCKLAGISVSCQKIVAQRALQKTFSIGLNAS